jgi:hypothetical protein
MVKPQPASFHLTYGYGWKNVDYYGWDQRPEEGVVGNIWDVKVPHSSEDFNGI